MKFVSTFDSAKSVMLALGLSFALAACGGESGTATNASGSQAGAMTEFERPGDHAIGSASAPVTIVEYASVVCGACANWHGTVMDDLKKKYIETGKVRFIFREFPTDPADMARAGFLVANCAAEDKFFDNIALQFKKQTTLFDAARNGQAKQEYIKLAKLSGLSEAEFEACMANDEENQRLDDVERLGIDEGVRVTPTFFINGEKAKVFTLESFDEALAPLLGEAEPETGSE